MKDRRPYALHTKVECSTTRASIEELVTRHGATSFASASDGQQTRILFEAHARRIRFEVRTDLDPAENRRRWRCLLMVIKAKLEAVADGLVTFEEEFLAQTIIPGSSGETISQWIGPQLNAAYNRGARMAPLLGDGI